MEKLAWDSKQVVPSNDGRYKRERSNDLYHTSRWTKLSRAYRQMHPLCVECKKEGKVFPATCIDHIIPWPVCGEAGFFDSKNLQPLCDMHNNLKGQKDKKLIQQWKQKHRIESR